LAGGDGSDYALRGSAFVLVVGKGVIRDYFCLVGRQTHLDSPLELWVRQDFLANSIGQYTSPPSAENHSLLTLLWPHSARSAPFFDFGAAYMSRITAHPETIHRLASPSPNPLARTRPWVRHSATHGADLAFSGPGQPRLALSSP